jgi:Ser/Thr protein kinase RdoA (MazF antagonist)
MTQPTPPLSSWDWPEAVRAEPAAGGLINQTWWVVGDSGRHGVLQRLNTSIFVPEVHHDIEAVTAHLQEAGITTPRLKRTRAGSLWATTDEGAVFRVLSIVGDRTVDALSDPADARSAAALVGRVHRALDGLTLHFRSVRPGVHDTEAHAATLAAAVAAHPTHRLAPQVAELADELAQRWSSWSGPQQLPTRIIHGDLKISNVRFDGSVAVALIDLDTWQHGTLDAELGDAMRSWCNASGEDVAEAEVRTDLFAAAMAGYASTAGSLLTPDEWEGLAPGLERIALELSMRFAADALAESYFGFDPAIGRGEHTLLRARGQLALARAARRVLPQLRKAVADARRVAG